MRPFERQLRRVDPGRQLLKHILAGVTEQKFGEMVAMVRQRTGILLRGQEGLEEYRGFGVRFRYDRAAETLALEMVKKPWFVPQTLIDRKIAEFVAGPGAAFLNGTTP